MANLPHKFENLCSGARPPGLIFGAGLSYGQVPLPQELLANKRAIVEEELDCQVDQALPEGAQALYEWAELILDGVLENGTPAKLRLAKSLGLLHDNCWMANRSLPLASSTPRHRIIARFSRERLWNSVWSLNWDRLLENALERIGLSQDDAVVNQPWITSYSTVVTESDFRTKLGRPNSFCILKPHGCVQALVNAEIASDRGDHAIAEELSDRFMIRSSELNTARESKTDEMFFTQMRAELQVSPLIIIGWSISEPYLEGIFNDAISEIINTGNVEELTIIDKEFNDNGHTKITDYYELEKDDVFAEMADDGETGFILDEFFQWLQARYCLAQLTQASRNAEVVSSLNQLTNVPDGLIRNRFVELWADSFLSSWVLLCWRAEIVNCEGYKHHQLILENNEEHIPWRIANIVRPDLQAAAELLSRLTAADQDWDVTRFPGCLWDESQCRLVVPVPTWEDINELCAFKPFFDTMPNKGFISDLDILPLHFENNPPTLSAEQLQNLKSKVASCIGIAGFAKPESLGIANDIWGE